MAKDSVKSKNLIANMADHYNLEPEEFKRVIKATCGLQNAKDEEFLAFLMIAHEHKLNPLTREIYAFVKSGGGIQPIIGVDGWYKKMNEHPAYDGLEFRDDVQGGQLVAVTARIYRKDRTHPTEVIEYMHECRRNTDPWKQWPMRMLRHKAAIQCIRVAFNLAGIMDPDEAERYQDMQKNETGVYAQPVEDLPLSNKNKPSIPDLATAAAEPPPQDNGGRKKRSATPAPPIQEAPPPPEEPLTLQQQDELISRANTAGMKTYALYQYVSEKYGLDDLRQLRKAQVAEVEQHLKELSS